ncbi:uncharacterized protein LOC126426981 [Schistocerca serialis cubense]|uniref:uncharacterized protein LOC126426981 n=1 Tax=Schistocerca serialis cubense TaxID=2023355 RepID=UPI00214E30BB|nr:uncharacterized protein LOC126426981 [Schistocerca serialis cubense]
MLMAWTTCRSQYHNSKAILVSATRLHQSIIQTVAPATTEKAAAPLQEPHVCLASQQIPLRCGCTYSTAICIVEACKPPHHRQGPWFMGGFIPGVITTHCTRIFSEENPDHQRPLMRRQLREHQWSWSLATWELNLMDGAI